VLSYSTYLGGSNYDEGNGIAVDPSGNAYVTGATGSTDFPTVNPLQATNKAAPSPNAFVAKVNAAGSSLVYSTYLGGSGSGNDGDGGAAIGVDCSGNVFVTGDTSSTDFPTINPLQGRYGGGNSDAFVANLNSVGSTLLYSTYVGGNDLGSSTGRGIAVHSAGDAYITGSTTSTNFPTVNPLQATKHGGPNAFVAKIGAADAAGGAFGPGALTFGSH